MHQTNSTGWRAERLGAAIDKRIKMPHGENWLRGAADHQKQMAEMFCVCEPIKRNGYIQPLGKLTLPQGKPADKWIHKTDRTNARDTGWHSLGKPGDDLWLKDLHINFFMDLLQEFGGGHIVSISSLWVENIDISTRFEKFFTRHLGRLGIEANYLFRVPRLLLLPLNQGRKHWILLAGVITPATKSKAASLCYLVFDSLNPQATLTSSARLTSFTDIITEDLRKRNGVEPVEVSSYAGFKVTIQNDGSSCGVFTCLNALELARGSWPELPKDVKAARKWLWTLMEGSPTFTAAYETLQRRASEEVKKTRKAIKAARKAGQATEQLETLLGYWQSKKFYMPAALSAPTRVTV